MQKHYFILLSNILNTHCNVELSVLVLSLDEELLFLLILNASNFALILFFHLVHECTRATAHYPQTMPNTCPSGVTSHSLLVAEATA